MAVDGVVLRAAIKEHAAAIARVQVRAWQEAYAGLLPAAYLDDEDAPRPDELAGLYVLAAHHGSGIGQALLDAIIGTAPAYLWIADGNARAESFYRRNGFRRDGAGFARAFGETTLDIVRTVR